MEELTDASLAVVAIVPKLNGELDDDPHADGDEADRSDPRHDLHRNA